MKKKSAPHATQTTRDENHATGQTTHSKKLDWKQIMASCTFEYLGDYSKLRDFLRRIYFLLCSERFASLYFAEDCLHLYQIGSIQIAGQGVYQITRIKTEKHTSVNHYHIYAIRLGSLSREAVSGSGVLTR